MRQWFAGHYAKTVSARYSTHPMHGQVSSVAGNRRKAKELPLFPENLSKKSTFIQHGEMSNSHKYRGSRAPQTARISLLLDAQMALVYTLPTIAPDGLSESHSTLYITTAFGRMERCAKNFLMKTSGKNFDILVSSKLLT